MLEISAWQLDRLIPSIGSAYMQKLEQTGSAHRTQSSERRKHSTSLRTPVRDASREHVVPEQGERIARALVEVLAEHGFAGTTVELVVKRARVSTRTFYKCFDSLQECLIAIMDSTLEQVVALASQEFQREECWKDGVRSTLAAVLCYFDREPELARVCMVETLAGGPVVLTRREHLLEAFRLLVLQHIERDAPQVPPLVAEGVMSSLLGIMHARIVTEKPGPFIELLGPLMGLIMAPYFGARGVQREIERGDKLARAILNEGSSPPVARQKDTQLDATPDETFLANLGNATARHLRECLLFLAAHPGSSNREVGAGINVIHQSQISQLLSHLLREGLATKRSNGKGKRNAWRLTPGGEAIAQATTYRIYCSCAQSEQRFGLWQLQTISAVVRRISWQGVVSPALDQR